MNTLFPPPPPQYIPAPYLANSSFLTTPQLTNYFGDFYASLGYISSAPQLVFERLVANLSGAFTQFVELEYRQKITTLEHERTALGSLNEQMKVELAELRSKISVIELECHQLTTPKDQKHGNDKIKVELEKLRPLPPVEGPVIGTFNTGEARSYDELRQTTSKAVFTRPYPEPPVLPVGLTSLYIAKDSGIRVRSYVENVRNDGFRINIGTWANAILHGAGCAWLELQPSDPDFQCGNFNTQEKHPLQKPQLETTFLVTFPRPYSTPPQVVAWINKMSLSYDRDWRLCTYVTNITTTGFTLHVSTWSDSVLYSAGVSWVSYTANKIKVSSGSFGTSDLRASGTSELKASGYIGFGNGVFTTPPRVIMAINRIDIDCKHDMRISLKSSDITAAGMTWCFGGWPDTGLYSAGASFIALI